jgi:hypothetical protein
MLKNDWVDNEVRSLKSEIHCQNSRSNHMFYKMLSILLILLFLTINAFGEICPCCYRELEPSAEISLERRYFPDTWRCSNPKCGYENYDGITHCALCGTKRK